MDKSEIKEIIVDGEEQVGVPVEVHVPTKEVLRVEAEEEVGTADGLV